MSKNSVTTLVPRLISAKETYPVRHVVLRKGRPISSCAFEGDELASTFHIGGFVDEKLVAVASFFEADQTQYNFLNAIQLRGMAVLETYHGAGYGQQLLTYGEQLVHNKNKPILWMNARKSALGFYTKLHYQTIGTVFEIPLVGEHYVLFKNI
tara:strand:+ start:1863 stop:2321 length:459 start_codon:yes stop_codon:yes gene_type:complete